MASLKGLSMTSSAGRNVIAGNRVAARPTVQRLMLVGSACRGGETRFHPRGWHSHRTCKGNRVGGRSFREGASWDASKEGGYWDPNWRQGAWADASFTSGWSPDDSPADMARQWARLFRKLESRFASRYGEDMINRWNVFLDEFAKEYSAGREGSRTPKQSGSGGPFATSADPVAADAQNIFAVDLEEGSDAYLLFADVPGLEKSALSIKLNPKERSITISGTKRRNPRSTSDKASPSWESAAGIFGESAGKVGAIQDDDTQGPAYRMFERQVGPFTRTVALPEDADLDIISARVEKGVLCIRIGRFAPPPPPEERIVEIL
eukprot:jgi/Botrbrau1/11039/Bobra.92_2s0011.1